MLRHVCFVTLAAAALTLGFVHATAEDDKLRDEAKKQFGILKPAPEATLAQPDVVLGRALFWDGRLSADGKTACASCHPAADTVPVRITVLPATAHATCRSAE